MSAGKPPLRAVVLDNDETTGSYGILFALMDILSQMGGLDADTIHFILHRLTSWCILHTVFRPGLRTLLRCCLALRKQKKIDAIIMYTNQWDTGDIYSVPQAIAYMMNILAGETVFDTILTRPQAPDGDGQYKKQFHRVLDAYPGIPKDIRDILFVDDYAAPDFIRHDGIAKPFVLPECWYKIDAYHRILLPKEVTECMIHCLHPIFGDDVWILQEGLLDCYRALLPTKSSIASAKPFLDLCLVLQKRYGYVPKALILDAANYLS